MISTTTHTDSFREPLREMLGTGARPEREVTWTKVLNLSTTDPMKAARELLAQRPSGSDPVVHMSLEPRGGETLDRATSLRLVQGALRDAGLEKHPVLIVGRRKGNHEEIHIALNRRSPHTRGYHLVPTKLIQGIRQQEALLGLRPGRERNEFLIPPTLRKVTRHSDPDLSRVEMRRSGNFHYQVDRLAQRPFQQSRSWEQLHSRLAEVGLFIHRDPRTDHLSNGVTKRNLWEAAHTSIGDLEKRFGPYKPPSPSQQPEPGRWNQISRLQEIGYRLTADQAIAPHDGTSPAARMTPGGLEAHLERRRHQLEQEIEQGLQQIYRRPKEAIRDWRMLERPYFLEHLATKPSRFGDLREGFWRGQRSALMLSDKVRELNDVDRQLHALRQPGKLLGLHRASPKNPGNPKAIKQELKEIVDRIGWSTAVRALPVAQLQAVRMAVGVSRQALSKILDPDLERDR